MKMILAFLILAAPATLWAKDAPAKKDRKVASTIDAQTSRALFAALKVQSIKDPSSVQESGNGGSNDTLELIGPQQDISCTFSVSFEGKVAKDSYSCTIEQTRKAE